MAVQEPQKDVQQRRFPFEQMAPPAAPTAFNEEQPRHLHYILLHKSTKGIYGCTIGIRTKSAFGSENRNIIAWQAIL